MAQIARERLSVAKESKVVKPDSIADNNADEVSWVEAELGTVQLGDKRLEWRLLDTAAKLANQPTHSINQACEDWADTKATYRLFDNKEVTPAKLLAPHYDRTRERLVGRDRVLSVQDTTYLNYTAHGETTGLGPIGTTKQQLQGMVLHTAMFFTLEGMPLGLGSHEVWVREQTPCQLTKAEKRKQPIAEKESFKWLQAVSSTMLRVPAGTQVVHVGDSEADIYELFAHAATLGTDLLVRAAQDRNLAPPELKHLWAHTAARPEAGTLQVNVQGRNNEPDRVAIVTVRYGQVTLQPPEHLRATLAPVHMTAIGVCEEAPPTAVTALEWLLLTTVPVLTFNDAVERIRWYRQRWQIEVYHKILKSGCAVEKCQLATAVRLTRFLALFAIIGWRLFWLTHIARQQPDAPCTVVLADHEWRALNAHFRRSVQSPARVPTVAEAMLWIARLGGFLARRGDGHPGATVIWRGWQRLNDISDTWLIFNPG